MRARKLPPDWLTGHRKARIAALWREAVPVPQIAADLGVTVCQLEAVSTRLRGEGLLPLHPRFCNPMNKRGPAEATDWWPRCDGMNARWAARMIKCGLDYADDDPRSIAEAGVFQTIRTDDSRSYAGSTGAWCAALGDAV